MCETTRCVAQTTAIVSHSRSVRDDYGIQGQVLSIAAVPGGTALPFSFSPESKLDMHTNSGSHVFLLEDASHVLDNEAPGNKALVLEDPQGSQARSPLVTTVALTQVR